MSATTDRPRPGFAWLWQRLGPRLERRGMAQHRRAALAGLSGRVVEIGCGHGASFAHLPSSVTQAVGVEPEPCLRAAAQHAAAGAPVPVSVRAGTAEAVPVATGWADAAVCVLVLCSVGDPQAAAAELRRILRPGGQLRLLEHVRAANAPGAGLQRAADLVWPRLAGGCHTSRATVDTIAAAGFRLQRVEHFTFPAKVPSPVAPHVLLAATAPPG